VAAVSQKEASRAALIFDAMGGSVLFSIGVY
jgi:hypothetical protein